MSGISVRFTRRADRFERLVAGVAPEQWGNPSPCEEWDARAVVAHAIDMLGVTMRAVGEDAVWREGEDPLEAFRRTRAALERLLSTPEVAERIVTTPAGTMPFARMVDEVFSADLVWHGWDLAKATGQDATIDPDEIAAALPAIDDIPPEMYRPEAFGPGVVVFGPRVEVPPDAPAQDRVLAAMGRQPGWTAPL